MTFVRDRGGAADAGEGPGAFPGGRRRGTPFRAGRRRTGPPTPPAGQHLRTGAAGPDDGVRSENREEQRPDTPPDPPPPPPPEHVEGRTARFFRGRRRLVHGLVFVALIGLQVHNHYDRGPTDGFDAHWFIGLALDYRDEGLLGVDPVRYPPLYPLWLSALMGLDPGYEAYLRCLHENLNHWRVEGGNLVRSGGGDLASCLRMPHLGFAVQAALGALAIALVWFAGHLLSGRPAVAHLAALIALSVPNNWLLWGTRHIPENLVAPLFAGFNLCLAWLVWRGRTKGPAQRAAVAILGGLLLGALALTRPPYEYLLVALPAAAAIWMFRERARRREVLLALGGLLFGASLLFAPWAAHRAARSGSDTVAATYGSEILALRLGFNEMSGRQWLASLPRWAGRYGYEIAVALFGEETVAPLDWGHPEYLGDRARNFFEGVPPEERFGVLARRKLGELPKHLAVSVPLAWRGMRQLQRRFPLGNLWWIFVGLCLLYGTERNRTVLAALSFCPFVILAINALVSESLPRYSLGLLLPVSAGSAWAFVRFADRLWTGVRRRRRRPPRREPPPNPALRAA